MTAERADEIIRKVIYSNLKYMPQMKDGEEAFQVGRMMGRVQRQLEIELSLEVESQKSEDLDKVLDKIRAEIIELRSMQNVGVLECLSIIDKYREEQKWRAKNEEQKKR